LAHPEFGHELLARVIEATKDLCQEEYNPRQTRLEGRNMSMVLSPAR